MSESNLWDRLRKGMRGVWECPQRHEDAYSNGIADTSFCAGGKHHWMELKFNHDWPARATTKVRPKRYTPEQKNWLEERGTAAGNVWILWQVGDEVMLFTWVWAQQLGTWDKQDTINHAFGYWERRIDYDELGKIFSGGC